MNGREWLARQLDAAGIGYQRERNCFTSLDNPSAAQKLMDRQLWAPWKSLLGELARRVNPVAREFHVKLPDGAASPVQYYWTVPQSEWASDVMFTSREELLPFYERLIRHGMAACGPGNVMRLFPSAAGRKPAGIQPKRLCNSDLRPLLFNAEPHDAAEQKRQSAAVSRQFALLRAHDLIRKVPHTHRYVLTDHGRLAITALLAARNANALELAKFAA